jgi:hypothetical protein
LPALVLLRKPLFGLASDFSPQRRKQPERYVPFALKLIEKFFKKN